MRIVIFGAGGFIGGWICEELASRTDVELVACIRQWSSAVRLARRGIDLVQVDLESLTYAAPIVAGADVVVNVSVPAPDREPELAARLYALCAQAGVKKFIQFSSIAVYGDLTGDIDEATPPKPSSEYGKGKAEMETRLLEAAAVSGPQLFIFRPSIVYGPFSENWTVLFARRIANGRWRSLGWAGAGICNLVHGRDVAMAVIHAAEAALAPEPHVVNINGPDLVTWNEYIERFGDVLGIDGRRNVDPLQFTMTSSVVDVVRKAGSWAKRAGISPSSVGAPALVEGAQSIVGLYPTPGELRLLRHNVRYGWKRAAQAIGFNPTVSLAEGLRQSADWCRVHGVIS